MDKKVILSVILSLVIIGTVANVYYSLGQPPTIFLVLTDSISCLNLVRGQDSIATWRLNTCTLTASSTYSPIYLTNSSVDLLITRPTALVLSGGLGFASYGTIQNDGDIIVNSALINYGQLINTKTGIITVNTLLLSMNVTNQRVTDSGIINNSGSLEIGKMGFVNNGNMLVNLGTLENNGTMYNFIAGINYSSSIVNSGKIYGVPIKNSINVTSQLNTTITAKTTIRGCAYC